MPATMENSLVVSYKVQHVLIIQHPSLTPRYLPKINKNLLLYKNLYMNIYINFICNKTKRETIKMFLIWGWMDQCGYPRTASAPQWEGVDC